MLLQEMGNRDLWEKAFLANLKHFMRAYVISCGQTWDDAKKWECDQTNKEQICQKIREVWDWTVPQLEVFRKWTVRY